MTSGVAITFTPNASPRPHAHANKRAFEVHLVGQKGVSHTVIVFARAPQFALAGASENLHTCGTFYTRDAEGNVWTLRRVPNTKTKQG